MITREELSLVLKDKIIEVEFTKKDGTNRILQCTLIPSYLPPPSETSSGRAACSAVMSVWGIKENAWRSFRLDSVIKWQEVVG